ncbi:MAG TPA: hypothetical protein VGQ46_01355 [Thermoanaerobaculia bacterium]|nr:hypothetical protein [Thermoanaerobaculia bacterium]
MNAKHCILIAALLAAACGGPSERQGPHVHKDPISVRGWIVDVETGPSTAYHTVETEAARKRDLFRGTNVWVENAPYVSGGVAETGSFLLLDVPPGDVTITFSSPGVPVSRLVLKHIPGNADVLIPAMLIKRDTVSLLDPKSAKVRLAAQIDKAVPTGAFADVGDQRIAVVSTPIREMVDRLDYPNPPASQAPLATVK